MIDQLEVDLRPNFGPVKDQGARPTCLSQALSAGHEYVRHSADRLSVEYLHYFSTGGDLWGGSSIASARTALELKGQPEETLCPGFELDPPTGWTPPPNLHVFRRRSITVAATCANVERAIRETRVPVLGISLPRQFFDPASPWIIAPSDRTYGLHAVVGVGVGRRKGKLTILIRNSWGASWGDGGHALLTSDFLRRHLIDVIILAEEPA